MLRMFRHDMENPEYFGITLELVPGAEFITRTVDTVMGLDRELFP